MHIKKLTNIASVPVYGAILFLLAYSLLIGAYMQALSFIGLTTLLAYGHNRLNDLYTYIGGVIK